MTNEQINKLAAEALGIKGWHPEPENPRGGLCKKCGELVHKHRIHFPDFCDDLNLNAAQRLLKSITVEFVLAHEGIGFNATLPILLKDNEWYCLTPRQVILTSAKTITLACLVALGKVTLEEAKESL